LLDKILFSDIHEKKEYGFPLSSLKTMKDIDVFSLPENALGCWRKGNRMILIL
jgi:hypothetical protein